MSRDYKRPDSIPEGGRIFIDPNWNELCVALQRIQRGCSTNRIHKSQLEKLYEQAQGQDFFSAYIMTSDEAPAGYGFPYYSSQACACRFGNVTGFMVRRESTSPGDYVSYPIYPLKPKDTDFVYSDWLDSVTKIFWTRLTDAELDALQMKPIVENILKEYHGKRKKSHRLPTYAKPAIRKLHNWRSRKRVNAIDY